MTVSLRDLIHLNMKAPNQGEKTVILIRNNIQLNQSEK